VVAFDLVFDLPQPGDAQLAAAARDFRRVVWASLCEHLGEPTQRLVLPVPRLYEAAPNHGHVFVPQDSDTPTVDGIDPVISTPAGLVPSLSLKCALMDEDRTGSALEMTLGRVRAGEVEVPVDEHGRVAISYLGQPGETFPVISYEELYRGAVDEPFYRETGFFRDRVVLIGDMTTVANDRRLTPVGDMWGVEIHAHAIATMLQGLYIRDLPQTVNVVVTVLLGLLVGLLVASWRVRYAVLATVVLLPAFWLINIALFSEAGLRLHLVTPSAVIALSCLGVLAERGMTEERDKGIMRRMLRRYLSPETAEYVLAHPDKCMLGGERVVATVLFSDIRGFTTFSESTSPEQAVEVLNEYLEAMTAAVFRHGGTVDKYVGDCVMALFGIPVPYADHAARSVRAALEMQAELFRLQRDWGARGLPLLDIGIGINTGAMVVGNVGSSLRVDFTVIGDAVNLASRVESLTKALNARILVTAATYDGVRAEVDAAGPIEASVPGRSGVVSVYEIRGWGAPSPE
jgi:adenylate cyclase